jgi:hypothetical protein
MKRVFLLSPASCGGERARVLLRAGADFDLARRVRAEGASIGEVFSFLSGLYFRGKLAYGRAFARVPEGAAGVLVITTSRGLVGPELLVTGAELEEFAGVALSADEERYVAPLRRDAGRLAASLAADDEVVLLGSIATGKYVNPLLALLGERLLFPAEFIGRGDMSRGGLLLRCVEAGRELAYVPVAGSLRRGRRPQRLEPRR